MGRVGYVLSLLCAEFLKGRVCHVPSLLCAELSLNRFLSVLFQKSLDSGQVPHDWTKASVIPIFKMGDKSDPINYRPILLACILCKVMEHIVASNPEGGVLSPQLGADA